MNNNYNNLLSKLQYDDTINLDEVSELIEMKRKILNAKRKHPYPIHHTEKSGWFTNVADPTAPSGLRKIRKASEEKLWDALATWYLENSNDNITLYELFEKWIDWKQTPNNEATIHRLNIAWNTYYLKEELSQKLLHKPFAKITSLELREWAEALMKKHGNVDQKKFSRMFTIINQIYDYASDEDRNIVSENIWQNKARKKINKALFIKKAIPDDDTQVFTDEERLMIKKFVYEDSALTSKHHHTSAGLQILFLFETGLRIGEACGLKWSDIKNGRLYISRQATNKGVVENTKTASGTRNIPLTSEALKILEDVKEYNKLHGFNKEWIFQSDNPEFDYRLSYSASSNKLRRINQKLGITHKSCHKCRKTVLSALLDSGEINTRTIQRFAGHKDISVTYSYYNYDRKSQKEQAEAIEKALSL